MARATEMETAILEKIKNPIVYKGGASCATYKMLNEEDIELARLSSRNSEPVRVALIELLTETLKSIAPGRYHMISHVTAALELKDRCLCDLALSAIRDGAHQGDIGSDYTDYQNLRRELIVRNPAMADYFDYYAQTFGPFLAR